MTAVAKISVTTGGRRSSVERGPKRAFAVKRRRIRERERQPSDGVYWRGQMER
jgi:hypothetical protein